MPFCFINFIVLIIYDKWYLYKKRNIKRFISQFSSIRNSHDRTLVTAYFIRISVSNFNKCYKLRFIITRFTIQRCHRNIKNKLETISNSNIRFHFVKNYLILSKHSQYNFYKYIQNCYKNVDWNLYN